MGCQTAAPRNDYHLCDSAHEPLHIRTSVAERGVRVEMRYVGTTTSKTKCIGCWMWPSRKTGSASAPFRHSRLPVPTQPLLEQSTSSPFTFSEPLVWIQGGSCASEARKIDWAMCIRELSDRHYLDANLTVLVMDTLNTHRTNSLCKAFALVKAQRLVGRVNIHHTSPSGSWL